MCSATGRGLDLGFRNDDPLKSDCAACRQCLSKTVPIIDYVNTLRICWHQNGDGSVTTVRRDMYPVDVRSSGGIVFRPAYLQSVALLGYDR